VEVFAVALVLLLPAGVAVHRLATGRRFPALSRWIVAAAAGQVLLPAALFGLFAAGVPAPTAGRYLAGFFELALAVAACCVVMWGLLLVLGVVCWVRPEQPTPNQSLQADGEGIRLSQDPSSPGPRRC
jgi:hypothetical protein